MQEPQGPDVSPADGGLAPAPPTSTSADAAARFDVEGALEELIDQRRVTVKLWADGPDGNHHAMCVYPGAEPQTCSGDTRAAALHAALDWARALPPPLDEG